VHIPLIHRETEILWEELGDLGTFCPICSRLSSFQAYRQTSQSRVDVLLAVTVSRGPLQSGPLLARCTGCGIEYLLPDGEALLGQTEAQMKERCARRLKIQQDLERGTLSADDRRFLLREPFLALAWAANAGRPRGGADRASRWGCLGTLALFPAMFLAAVFLPLTFGARDPMKAGELLIRWGFGAMALSLGLTWTAYVTRKRRYVRKTLVPPLTRTLMALDPTRPELEDAVEHLRSVDPAPGARFNPREIFEAIRVAKKRKPLIG